MYLSCMPRYWYPFTTVADWNISFKFFLNIHCSAPGIRFTAICNWLWHVNSNGHSKTNLQTLPSGYIDAINKLLQALGQVKQAYHFLRSTLQLFLPDKLKYGVFHKSVVLYFKVGSCYNHKRLLQKYFERFTPSKIAILKTPYKKSYCLTTQYASIKIKLQSFSQKRHRQLILCLKTTIFRDLTFLKLFTSWYRLRLGIFWLIRKKQLSFWQNKRLSNDHSKPNILNTSCSG